MKIQKNVIAMIVIMGITVIPTLYAWFNISASWDPYGNTGALKLAVASDDEGYESDLIFVISQIRMFSFRREDTHHFFAKVFRDYDRSIIFSGFYTFLSIF